ncbi:helix-turn-helix domain-containing protein [bacterium AH-315-N03]|nr:helix-turn-helix domain-containing protein [bacterium AH-315-N03]
MSPREGFGLDSQSRVRGWASGIGPTTHEAGAHTEVELAWVEEGEMTYHVGATTLRVPPGSAILIPAGVRHHTQLAEGTRTGSLWLDPELIERLAPSLGQEAVEVMVVNDAEVIVRLGNLLRTEVELQGPGWLRAVDALCEALVVAMLRGTHRNASGETEGGSSQDPRIKAAVQRIEKEYAESLSVDDLARTAGMSRYHFSRRFRDEMGHSPYKFLVRVRVERAAEFLRAGLSVTEAAYEVGFGGLGRFSRAFRARFGVLPSRYSA